MCLLQQPLQRKGKNKLIDFFIFTFENYSITPSQRAFTVLHNRIYRKNGKHSHFSIKYLSFHLKTMVMRGVSHVSYKNCEVFPFVQYEILNLSFFFFFGPNDRLGFMSHDTILNKHEIPLITIGFERSNSCII